MGGMLQAKNILVTGAASGIGLATALLAAYEGANVALCDRDESRGKDALELVSAVGGDAIFIAMDVTDEAQVANAFDAAVQRFGGLNGAFNNAGISADGPDGRMVKTADLSTELWRRVMAVNLEGCWQCVRHALRHMGTHGGSIVNNASIAGLVGLKGQAAYSASKHGVVGLTRTAAAEYARDGVRVNAICPGFVTTPLTAPVFARMPAIADGVPARRLGTPEEIAEVAVWLLSDRSAFVTGAVIAADGGYTAI